MQSESLKKQVKAIWAVLAMLTIWQISVTAKVNTFMPNLDSINQSVNIMLNRISDLENVKEEIEDNIDEYEELYKEQNEALETFDEKFSRMRDIHGSGHLLDWNGNLYTTYYAEELVTHNE